jgi:hypothetical protein
MIMDNDNTAWRGNSQDPSGGNPALIGWGEAVSDLALNLNTSYHSSYLVEAKGYRWEGRGFPSTGPHGVQVKLVIPGLGLTPLTEIKLSNSN